MGTAPIQVIPSFIHSSFVVTAQPKSQPSSSVRRRWWWKHSVDQMLKHVQFVQRFHFLPAPFCSESPTKMAAQQQREKKVVVETHSAEIH